MKRIIIIFFLLLFSILFPSRVLAAQKHIEIDLSTQRLLAYEDNTKVYEFAISSGKAWTPTPVGTYKPWTKLPSTRMRGGSVENGTYYDLPNVPYVVYFYKGYAIHGTYWHNNFGVPMSHGCVNVRTSDMAVLYPWIDYDTQIRIYGSTPQ